MRFSLDTDCSHKMYPFATSKRPFLRILSALGLTLALLSGAFASETRDLTVNKIALDPYQPKRTGFGRLVWRGGFVLRHSDDRFGGLSGLHVSQDGKTMTAVTDRGDWIKAQLHYSENRLSGMSDISISPIHGADGRAVGGHSGDAESIAPDGDGGFFIAFERRHRISRYAGSKDGGSLRATPTETFAPKAKWRQPTNGGYEGLTRLCDGRLFAIAEMRKPGAKAVRAWLRQGDEWQRLYYSADGSFRPTGMATLPDCSILVLERRFNLTDGLGIRLMRLSPDAIQPGATLQGTEIALLDTPLTIDNMEGIAARRGDKGETILYLVSDDNFSPLQRTLLLMFELRDDVKS